MGSANGAVTARGGDCILAVPVPVPVSLEESWAVPLVSLSLWMPLLRASCVAVPTATCQQWRFACREICGAPTHRGPAAGVRSFVIMSRPVNVSPALALASDSVSSPLSASYLAQGSAYLPPGAAERTAHRQVREWWGDGGEGGQ